MLGLAAVVLAPETSSAQSTTTLQRDPVWNGVLIGMAAGAGYGVYEGTRKTEEPGPCDSMGCAVPMALLGGFVGLGVDKLISRRHVVEPGSLVDDRLRNGTLIGTAAFVSLGLVMSARQKDCEGSPCDLAIKLLITASCAVAGAAVGALVDAAIPSRAPRISSSATMRQAAHRPIAFRIGWRF